MRSIEEDANECGDDALVCRLARDLVTLWWSLLLRVPWCGVISAACSLNRFVLRGGEREMRLRVGLLAFGGGSLLGFAARRAPNAGIERFPVEIE